MKKFIFIALSLLFVKQGFGASPSPQLPDLTVEDLAKQCLFAQDPHQFYIDAISKIPSDQQSKLESEIRDAADQILNLGEVVVHHSGHNPVWAGEIGANFYGGTVAVIRRKIDQLSIEEILNLFKKTTPLRFINKNICEIAKFVGNQMNISIRVHKSAEDLNFSININDKLSPAQIWNMLLKILKMSNCKIIKHPAIGYYVIADKDVVDILPIDLL